MNTKITPSMLQVLQQIAADKSPYDMTAHSGAWVTRALNRCLAAGLCEWRSSRRQLTDAGRAALAQGDAK